MLKRLQQLVFFLLIFFVLYLLAVRVLVSWVQWAPQHFLNYAEQFTGAEINVQQIDITQSWLGFDFEVRQLEYKETQVSVHLNNAQGDFNLFSPFLYDISFGQNLNVSGLELISHASSPSAGSAEDHVVLQTLERFSLAKLWRTVRLKDLSLVYADTSGQKHYLSIDNLQTYRGAKWSFAGIVRLGITSGDITRIQVKGDFALDSLGRAEAGEMRANLLTPLDMARLYQIMPQAWSEKLPTGETLGDVSLQLRHGRLASLKLTTSAQDLVWPMGDDHLPKSIGMTLNWVAENSLKDGVLQNWRFEIERVRFDNQYLRSVSPIYLTLTENTQLKFEAQKLNLKELKPLYKVLLTQFQYQGLGDNLDQLKLRDVSGVVDLEKITLPSLSLELAKLEWLEQGNRPGLAIKQLFVEKQAQRIRIQSDNPIEWTVSMINPRPIQMRLAKNGLDVTLLKDWQGWRLPPVSFTLDTMPVHLEAEGDFTGYLDGRIDIEPKQLSFVKRYLPYSLMSEDFEHWLKTALVAGDQVKANLVVKGHLNDFPFQDGNGIFKATGEVHNAVLQFQPDWPAVEQFKANLEFTPYNLRISADQAVLQKAQVSQVVVDINHLDTSNIAVQISGHASADAAEAKQFLLTSPVAKMIGMESFLNQQVVMNGPVFVALPKIWIPVYGYANKSETVEGRVTFQGVNATLFDRLPLLALKGNLDFTEKGVKAQRIKGMFEGHEVIADVRTENQTVQIGASGRLAERPAFYTGALPVGVQVQVPFEAEKPIQVAADFDLAAIQSRLPAPFSETSMSQNRPSSLQVTVGVLDDQTLDLTAFMGEFMSMSGRYSVADAELQKLAMAFNQPPIAVDGSGWRVHGYLNRLDLNGWQQAWPNIQSQLMADKLYSEDAGANESPWLPSSLLFGQVDFMANQYQKVTFGWLKPSDSSNVQLQVYSQALDIHAEQLAPEHYAFKVNKLRFKTSTGQTNESETPPSCLTADVAKLGALKVNFNGRNIHIDDRRLAAADFMIENKPDELIVKDFSLRPETLKNAFKGTYRYNRNTNKSALDTAIKTNNAEALVAFIGVKQGFRGDGAFLKANIHWLGDYECFDVAKLDGDVTFEFENGVIKEAEPGLARILGLLSFESLARRLQLDLKDVTDAGLAYDDIEGRGVFKHGKLELARLKMDAPAADAVVTGNIDLVKSELDLVARITPAIGSTLPAIAAISGLATPLAGLAAYALLKVVPIVNADLVTYRFGVTGTFADPIITDKGVSLEPIKLNNKSKTNSESVLDN